MGMVKPSSRIWIKRWNVFFFFVILGTLVFALHEWEGRSTQELIPPGPAPPRPPIPLAPRSMDIPPPPPVPQPQAEAESFDALRQKFLSNFVNHDKYDEVELENIKRRVQESQYPNERPDYSILRDPAYTVQLDELPAYTEENAKTCIPFRSWINFTVCPIYDKGVTNELWYHRPDNKDQIGHVQTFGALLRYLQLSPGAAYIDVGAHIGLFALAIMAAFGANPRPIIAIEPFDENLYSLALGIRQNKFPLENWAVIKRGLADTVDETVEMKLIPGTSIGSLKSKIRDSANWFSGKKFEVKTATFDSHVLPVAKAMNVTSAVLKLDIEGAECLALQYTEKFLAEINVLYIISENTYFRGFPHVDCIKCMIRVLRKASYVPFQITSLGLEKELDDDFTRWADSDNYVWKKIL